MSESSRRWIVLAATLLVMALTARLGVWQLSRATQKEALQASVDSRRALPPLAAADLARDATAAADQRHRRIGVSGRWLPQHTIYLENRQRQARPGFEVLTPLELAPGDVVLVQRGWAPRDLHDRTRVPTVATPAGVIAIEARIAPAPARLYSFASDERGPLRQNLDLDAFARETGLALRPLSLQQLDAAADGLSRDWPAPAVDVHRHYGYAFQWFALCALVAALYVWFQLIRPRRRR
ncbi:SURF1 family protein [Rivibacter subsaxonicus]|uniref:SURF1-like protein n=1 Tax=Rivibacter subsaxonicus TaxID=457575 RepID=A0A4Q7VGR5_9BURK|nr:SURF1 family protein [Rivibacter subsaxonicus]RZT95204.1 surfeit locus 1 family protein [Rivibacter subsaxonicus]